MQFEPEESPTDVDALQTIPPCAIVVDDDDDVRLMLSATLRCEGFYVIEARNGLEVIDHVGRIMLGHAVRVPDVIVSDAKMPGVNGLSLLESLRQSGCTTPVVFMTAYGGDDFRSTAKRLGAVDVFEKPLDIDALRTMLLNLARR